MAFHLQTSFTSTVSPCPSHTPLPRQKTHFDFKKWEEMLDFPHHRYTICMAHVQGGIKATVAADLLDLLDGLDGL